MQTQARAHPSSLNRLRTRAKALRESGGLAVIVLLLLAGYYALEYQHYRAYDIDNSWFLSFSYNDFVSHVSTDTFLKVPFPDGMDGTGLFGKTAAFIQSIVLSRSGWEPLPATLISIAFTLASLLLLWAALRKWQVSGRLAVAFLLLVGVSEPILSMAEKCRYEFFSFFLFSLALWLAACQREFLAFVPAFFAVETEPIAIVAPLVVLLLLWPRTRSRQKLLVRAASGALVAFAAYLLLHPHGIASMLAAHALKSQAGSFHSPLYGYFVQRRRHIAELIAFLAGGWCFWKHRREIRFPGLAAATLVCLLILGLLPHDNPAYMVFLCPLLYLVALLGFERAPRWQWILYCAFFIGLAQEAYLYRLNRHEGLTASDVTRVSGMISQAESKLHIDDATAQIVGDPTLWFAHPGHYSARLSDLALYGNLYLCFTGRLQEGLAQAAGAYTCQMLKARLPLRTVSSVTLRSGHTVYLLARTS